MTEALKDMFNIDFFNRFTNDLKLIIKGFNTRKFISQIMDNEWEKKEFKQRCWHITAVLKNYLPADYKEAIAKILELLDHLKDVFNFSEVDDTTFGLSLEYGWVLDNFVEQYGLDDYETSIKAIEKITQFTSCEFAVRPFIIKYPKEMMKQMLVWSKHEHWGVRRLSSEGCRPRLPWAMGLSDLKENPAPIIPILENLKNDTSRFVRLSVANNLNDIAKDNPETVINLIKKWQGKSENINWVIKHGSRTLLKQGNAEAMEIFGFGTVKNITIKDFKISRSKIKIGEFLEFSFKLVNNSSKKAKIRLEYGIYYQKANKTLSKKVCKISEKEYAKNSITDITRRHSFRAVTTRVLHSGLHQVSIIINGKEFQKYDFELIDKK
ncbi:MAG: DNA alkylation repair protein [Treponema sp.]|nr:DNA alkylation repair protein [Treponema sp.]